jgi:uncharacterized membrane-anchored protein
MKVTHLFALSALWLCIIFGLIGYKEWTHQTGRTVMINVEPVDPTDLFRGSYVQLAYNISRFSSKLAFPLSTEELYPGMTVYVLLDEQGGVVLPKQLVLEPPSNELFITGTLRYANDEEVSVEYGIESYFAPTDKAKELERRGREIQLQAEVAVDSSGQAVLRDLKAL